MTDQISTKREHISTPCAPDHTAGSDIAKNDDLQQLSDRIAGKVDATQTLVESELGSTVELTVVIPVYNEPVTVSEIVSRVRNLPISKQIVIVNDGSTDGTAESLNGLSDLDDVEVIHHSTNRGKGAALRTGFKQATGRFVIVQDADLEYDPLDILKVIAPLQAGASDVVYGSRYLESPQQDRSSVHRFGNWALTAMSNYLTGYELTDMETCYKAFRRVTLDRIDIEQSRFGFEPEITAKLSKYGVAIQEVGISYSSRSREEGKKIGIRDLFNAIYCILRYGLFR